MTDEKLKAAMQRKLDEVFGKNAPQAAKVLELTKERAWKAIECLESQLKVTRTEARKAKLMNKLLHWNLILNNINRLEDAPSETEVK